MPVVASGILGLTVGVKDVLAGGPDDHVVVDELAAIVAFRASDLVGDSVDGQVQGGRIRMWALSRIAQANTHPICPSVRLMVRAISALALRGGFQ
ncbi:MAG: hypothetical protein LBJ62_07440 [Bifidobacteriaceae bacterium]|nr:hypothetical protein [Bifidobacteriaceae bacterium]